MCRWKFRGLGGLCCSWHVYPGSYVLFDQLTSNHPGERDVGHDMCAGHDHQHAPKRRQLSCSRDLRAEQALLLSTCASQKRAFPLALVLVVEEVVVVVAAEF